MLPSHRFHSDPESPDNSPNGFFGSGRGVLLVCFLWATAFGLASAALFTRSNHVYPVGMGHAWLALLLTGAYTVLALGAVLAGRLLERWWPTARPSLPLWSGPWLLVLVLALSVYRERINTHPRTLGGTLVTLAILAIMVAILALVVRWTRFERCRAAGTGLAIVGLLGCLAGAVWLGTAKPVYADPPANAVSADLAGPVTDTGLRILLLGMDGGDWKVFDPLLAEGRLKAHAKLAARGLTAVLKTDVPCFSPILWTSIATGKLPHKHGVFSHVRTHLPVPGLPSVPNTRGRMGTLTKLERFLLAGLDKGKALQLGIYSSNQVGARPVWDVLGEFGLPSVVLEWYVTHPARPLNGILVSDRFHSLKGFAEDLARCVYPDSLAPVLATGLLAPDELPQERLAALVDLTASQNDCWPTLLERYPVKFRVMREEMARDLSTNAAAKLALEQLPEWQLAALYWRGMDNAHHMCWEFRDLPGTELDRHLERRLRTVVDRYYDFCDELLADVLPFADDRTVVILLSDHGWEDARYGHFRGPDGYFVMAGGPTRVDERRAEVSIYDIAPTILALLGIPVPEDMDGRVLTELVDPAFWREHPVRFVPSYDHVAARQKLPDETQMDEEMIEQLRALGYVR